MRLAVLGDIHGNAPALEAVLEDIRAEHVDRIVVAGDVLAGPLPLETLALLMELGIPTHIVRGNHDTELQTILSEEKPGVMRQRENDIAQWIAGKLSAEHTQLVSSWQTTHEIEMDGWGNVLFCHATPHSDSYVFSCLTPESKLMPILRGLNASLMVCAHTHMQFDRLVGDLRIANTGSVGMCVGRTGADWLVIDEDIHFRHTDYDTVLAAERIRQSDYPHADEFANNNLLQAWSEARMFEVIAYHEANQTSRMA